MAELDLGDARLDRRAMKVLHALSVSPGASLPCACGTHTDLIGAYRLFDNEAVTLPQLLAGHRAATLARAAHESVVLAVQDSTWLDYSTHRACEGLGGHTHAQQQGMLLHLSLLVSGEGQVLGTLEAPTLLHGRLAAGTVPRSQRSREQRQSHRWVQAHAQAMRAAAAQPQVTWISVQDREGDLYPLLALPRPANGHWLVRVQHDRHARAVEPQAAPLRRLRAHAAAAPVCGTMQVTVPARPGRPARTAMLRLSQAQVCLSPPRRKKGERASAALPAVEATLVRAFESDPPAGQPPVDWWLLSSFPLGEVTAEQRVRWYHARWRIEEFFRVLKSETAIEERQLGTRRRLEAALGLHLILTWRICTLRDQSRAHPQLACTTMFSETEWRTLTLLATGQIPAQPPTLGAAVAMLGRLGGHLGRKADGPPGHRTIAHGLRSLHAALRLAEKLNHPTLSKDV